MNPFHSHNYIFKKEETIETPTYIVFVWICNTCAKRRTEIVNPKSTEPYDVWVEE